MGRLMRRPAVYLVALIALFLVTLDAAAQVNTEAMLSDGRSDPWSAYGDFALALKRGNTESARATLGGGGRIMTLFRDPDLPVGGEPWFRDRIMLSGSWSLENAKGERVDHVAFVHARWTRMWIPRVGHEILAQANYAEFNRLNRRLLVGGGARVVVFNDAFAQFWFGTGLFAEDEDFDLTNVDNAENFVNRRLNARWSTYVTLKINASDQKIAFINTLYVQPTLADFTDARIFYEGRLTARVYRMFAVSANATVTYDTTPVPGIQRTDIRLGGAIQFRLYGKSTPVTPVHIGPTHEELVTYALAQARPIAQYRVGLAVEQAQRGVVSELSAREQRRARALVEAQKQCALAADYARRRANTSPSSTRLLAAAKEPNAAAAMDAAFTAASVITQAYRLQPRSVAPTVAPDASETNAPATAPPKPARDRNPAPEDIEGPDPVMLEPVVF